MIRKITQGVIMVMLLFISQHAFSQTKPGCEPKSCGPGNTKIAEAKVITDLRNDLQEVLNKMVESNLNFDKSVTSLELTKGSSDDESILFISSVVAVIRTELISKLSEEVLLPEIKDHRPVPVSSKQEMLINLKKDVKILTEQVVRI